MSYSERWRQDQDALYGDSAREKELELSPTGTPFPPPRNSTACRLRALQRHLHRHKVDCSLCREWGQGRGGGCEVGRAILHEHDALTVSGYHMLVEEKARA